MPDIILSTDIVVIGIYIKFCLEDLETIPLQFGQNIWVLAIDIAGNRPIKTIGPIAQLQRC